MSDALVPLHDIEKMAASVVSSRMFPGITTKEGAVTLMLLCQSEGLHPMQALTRYHIIQNRPAMKADAMLAEFMRRGGTVEWIEWTDKACEARFTSAGVPKGVLVRWTMEDAKKAGVTGNPTWSKYPRQMLKARVASDGVRMADPVVNQGRYTPEEVADFDPPKIVAAEAEIVASPALEPSKETQRREGPACDCGSPTLTYESESKAFLGRKYRMCEWAYNEKRNMIEEGATNKTANAAVASHYREWAEPWPRGDADRRSVAGVQPTEPNEATVTPETFAKIEQEVAARLAAEE